MGGKSGKKKGGGYRHAESLSMHIKRIEAALSTLESVVMAHCAADTPDKKEQALVDMKAAIGESMEVRTMRQQYNDQVEEVRVLHEQVEAGNRAEQKMVAAEDETKRIRDWFEERDHIMPYQPQANDSYAEEAGAVPTYAPYAGAEQAGGGQPIPPSPLTVDENGETVSGSQVRPSTNRQMVNNLSNPRR